MTQKDVTRAHCLGTSNTQDMNAHHYNMNFDMSQHNYTPDYISTCHHLHYMAENGALGLSTPHKLHSKNQAQHDLQHS